MLRCGFLISPAIKVTLFHASLLKIEPTIAAAIAPSPAARVKLSLLPRLCRFHASVQLAAHTSFLNMINPKTIRPNKLASLVTVKVVCISLPLLIPRVLTYVRKRISTTDTNCAGDILTNPKSNATRLSLTDGTRQAMNFAKATPTAAIVAVCMTAKKLHPYRNAASGLKASFRYTY